MKTTSFAKREDVLAVPLPKRTETYTPVSNLMLINAIETIAGDYGMYIDTEDYRLTGNGNAMVATYRMKGQGEIGAMLASMNSYDKSRRLSVASGGNVFICMNGMIIGEHTFQNKHVGGIDENLYNMIEEMVAQTYQELEILNSHSSLMRDTRIDSLDVAHVLGELFFEENMLTTQQLNIVKKELKESDNFKMKDPEDYHVWNLYNNITEALKISHPHNYIKDHIQVHNFMEKTFFPKEVEEIDFEEMLTS